MVNIKFITTTYILGSVIQITLITGFVFSTMNIIPIDARPGCGQEHWASEPCGGRLDIEFDVLNCHFILAGCGFTVQGAAPWVIIACTQTDITCTSPPSQPSPIELPCDPTTQSCPQNIVRPASSIAQ